MPATKREDLIRQFEELSFSEWPAHETLFYDSWIIRLAGGYTKRANSVNMIYGMGCIPYPEKLDFCESTFRDAGVTPIFKLTELSGLKELDSILERRGYEIVEPSQVMLRSLDQYAGTYSDRFTVYANLDNVWLGKYAAFKQLQAVDVQNFRRITEQTSGTTFHMSLENDDNEPIAVGTGSLQRGWLGILNIHTRAEDRGKGYGRQMVAALLSEGKRLGAQGAYLQVVSANKPAVRLYERCGFSTVYNYWYRVKK